MLDDLFKNMIVLVDGHYVKKPDDFAAATAAKALFAAMKKTSGSMCDYWGLPM